MTSVVVASGTRGCIGLDDGWCGLDWRFLLFFRLQFVRDDLPADGTGDALELHGDATGVFIGARGHDDLRGITGAVREEPNRREGKAGNAFRVFAGHGGVTSRVRFKAVAFHEVYAFDADQVRDVVDIFLQLGQGLEGTRAPDRVRFPQHTQVAKRDHEPVTDVFLE